MKEVKRFRHEPAFMVCDVNGDYVLAVDYLICGLELKDFQWGASVEADAGDEARTEVSRLKAENESLRADAERYRWLKEKGISRQIVGSGSQSVGSGPYIIMTLPSCGAPSSIALTFESADYVIDAAINSPENPY